ncbi:hypothetical protein L195_g056709 [Trifolium pratense]|uniref:Uncharacterized protein n=1 Tax=Trifolium pratense TaxID=57577 RepID=A0A2K3KT06_TRIPR|nr:hypothetical protein L195_g056709 [Trifolium pratense]
MSSFLTTTNKSVITSVIKIDSLRQACSAAFGSTQTAETLASIPHFVTWARPMEGTICLNVDGSLLDSLNSAGYGGLLRNHNGEFMSGFYGRLIVYQIRFRRLIYSAVGSLLITVLLMRF